MTEKNITKDRVLQELLNGIHTYTKIINQHKGAVLERENLDSLVHAYSIISDSDESDETFKNTLRETFNL